MMVEQIQEIRRNVNAKRKKLVKYILGIGAHPMCPLD